MSIIKLIGSLCLSLILIITVNHNVYAASSSNIPLDSSIYEDLERLELKGLINSGVLSSKPFSRIEGARIVKEAIAVSSSPEFKDKTGYQSIIDRLKKEFAIELTKSKETYESKESEESEVSQESVRLTPLKSAYLTILYSYAEPIHISKNNSGNIYTAGANIRAGFSSAATFYDSATILLAPEMSFNNKAVGVDFYNAYLLLDIVGIELEIGRDSMWWGNGKNGSLLLSNNMRPFDMIKLTSTESFILPWIFQYLGQFKPVVFYTSLESKRDIPNAKFAGMRLDFKPLPQFQIGLTRTIMFGGDGRATMGIGGWFNTFFVNAISEHFNSTYDNDQLASIDAALTFSNQSDTLPFTGLRLYTEWGAEDSAGAAGGGIPNPNGFSYMVGLLVDEPARINGVDIRAEWADTAMNERYGVLWYKHGVYTFGYTYNRRVMGHAMGGDANSLYLRTQYHLDNGGVLGVEYEGVWSGIHRNSTSYRWLGGDISYPVLKYLTLEGGGGYETTKDSSSSFTVKGIVIWTTAKLNF